MIRTTSTTRPQPSGRPAFTLIEMIVVIGIIAGLLSIAVVGLVKVRKSASRTATAFQIQTISTAIDAYEQDHGIYPPIATDATGQPLLGTGFATLGMSVVGVGGKLPGALDGTYTASVDYGMGNHVESGGAFYLCIYRNGDSPVPAPPNPTYWYTPWNGADGVDGPGFKMNRSLGPDNTIFTADDVVTGRTYGPYLRDGFRTRGFAVIDREDRAILYYPLTGRRPNIRTGPAGSYVGSSNASLVDNRYNSTALLPLTTMRRLMGDVNDDGLIGTGETPAFDGKYIIWAAGDDNRFGYGPTSKYCDDIANFEIPESLRR